MTLDKHICCIDEWPCRVCGCGAYEDIEEAILGAAEDQSTNAVVEDMKCQRNRALVRVAELEKVIAEKSSPYKITIDRKWAIEFAREWLWKNGEASSIVKTLANAIYDALAAAGVGEAEVERVERIRAERDRPVPGGEGESK